MRAVSPASLYGTYRRKYSVYIRVARGEQQRGNERRTFSISQISNNLLSNCESLNRPYLKIAHRD